MPLKDIAVGVDGSDDSADALRWAADLADASGSSIRAISSWDSSLIRSERQVLGGLPSQAFIANYCAETLDKTRAAAGISGQMATSIRDGHPGQILAAETQDADLVVVGRAGTGQRRVMPKLVEAVVGATARYCTHHADGPVAVVPTGRHWVTDPTVVVGVDGSPASHAALTWAVENLPEVARIRAVRAISPHDFGQPAFDHEDLDRTLATADRELDESIKLAVAHLGPEALERVEPIVLVESARFALLDPGFDFHVLVVGARGRSPVASQLLGSISDHAVRYAHCPVVVVPARGRM